MLLGLALAILLALMLQMNALRARRAAAFDCAQDGVIDLKAWIVLETSPIDELAPCALEAARQVLMLPSRLARVVRRRLFHPAAWRLARLLDLWRAPAAPAEDRIVAATGPPPWRSPRPAQTSPPASNARQVPPRRASSFRTPLP